VRPTWPAPSITIFMGGVLYGAAMHILYGHPESGHTYKVALCLALMDETFEYRWVDVFAPREQRRADFQAVSRYGEIPVLVDDGEPWVQSNSILLHLAGKHRALGGESPQRLERAREWLFWEANRIGLSLPNLRHYLKFSDVAAPQAVLDWLHARLQFDLRRLDDEFRAHPWLLGDGPSVADIACFAYLHYDDIGLDLADYPRLQQWVKRMREQPRFVDARTALRKPA